MAVAKRRSSSPHIYVPIAKSDGSMIRSGTTLSRRRALVASAEAEDSHGGPASLCRHQPAQACWAIDSSDRSVVKEVLVQKATLAVG